MSDHDVHIAAGAGASVYLDRPITLINLLCDPHLGEHRSRRRVAGRRIGPRSLLCRRRRGEMVAAVWMDRRGTDLGCT